MTLGKLNGWGRPLIEVVTVGFALGVGWMALKAKVETKADKATVEAMASDLQVIKRLVCRTYPDDSACPQSGGGR